MDWHVAINPDDGRGGVGARMSELVPYFALAASLLSTLFIAAEKLWGGGNALAAKFHALDKETSAAISALETKVMHKIEGYQDNYTTGAEAIRANIHALQLGLLEFRAKMAEEYVRTGGLDDIRTDMHRGFEAVDKRMGELQDMIMWARPDGDRAHPKPR